MDIDNEAIDLLKARLAQYEEEVARLKAHGYALWLENDRLQNSFIDINLDCDKKLDEAQEIVLDLLATGERLTAELREATMMPEDVIPWWIPSFATARVWIAQRNKK